MPPISDEINPCSPSPCGANAVCKERNGVGSCLCLAEYFGDPYTGCRPECVQNSECDRTKACINNRCKDPCPGVCGINASKFPSARISHGLNITWKKDSYHSNHFLYPFFPWKTKSLCGTKSCPELFLRYRLHRRSIERMQIIRTRWVCMRY